MLCILFIDVKQNMPPSSARYNGHVIEDLDTSRFGNLMFQARRLVDGLYAGRHLSPRAGPGADFFDYRQYSYGDSVTEVDWKLYGRTDRYHIRRYRRHSEVEAYLLVDSSASMHFAGLDRAGQSLAGANTKLRYAATLAAAIAMLTIRQADRAGVGLFGPTLKTHLPVGGTFAHLRQVVAALDAAEPIQGAGEVGTAIHQARALARRRGLFIVISDLLDEPAGFFDGLNRLRHDRFEVIVFQVLTPDELGLEHHRGSQLRLVDSETRQTVDTDVRQVHRRYRQLIEAHVDTLRSGCLSRGIDYNLLRTDEPVMDALRHYLVRRASLAVRG